ncbi:chemotaxis protein CheB [Variovorax sp. J22R24]|uniref:chemotaxis protein CheB n=1 Tax=Variovorax gracilis TaxID=3053502 RepID=UPI002574C514|nr:chemotaxis protein CheB [Variovorax sp. J22R24]MDM0108827.1 chemotaxis protein CheB [Variovorax sp. J22R24]
MRDLVVIGGSLAGLRRLCGLIDQLPSTFQAPILAVVHASPDRSASPVKLLGACTSLPVTYGAEGANPVAGRVYLAPGNQDLIVRSPGVLGLAAAGRSGPSTSPSASDRLFESAARACGPRVIGVLLAGGDVEGLDGLRAINAAGGIGVFEAAEDAEEAVHARTRSRAGGGGRHFPEAQYCLPLDDIAELLRQLVDGVDVTPA